MQKTRNLQILKTNVINIQMDVVAMFHGNLDLLY